MQPPLRLGLCGYFVTLGKVESLQPKAPRPSPCSHIFCLPAFLPQMPGCGHLGAYTSHPLYLDHAPLLSASVAFHCSIAPENPLLPDHVPGRALVFCPGRHSIHLGLVPTHLLGLGCELQDDRCQICLVPTIWAPASSMEPDNPTLVLTVTSSSCWLPWKVVYLSPFQQL